MMTPPCLPSQLEVYESSVSGVQVCLQKKEKKKRNKTIRKGKGKATTSDLLQTCGDGGWRLPGLSQPGELIAAVGAGISERKRPTNPSIQATLQAQRKGNLKVRRLFTPRYLFQQSNLKSTSSKYYGISLQIPTMINGLDFCQDPG
jgi:hypothetical protein